MTQPQDAALIARLETEYWQLSSAVEELELMRRTLVPGPATFWKGTARHAYDAAITGLTTTVEAGLAALRSARDRVGFALTEVMARVG